MVRPLPLPRLFFRHFRIFDGSIQDGSALASSVFFKEGCHGRKSSRNKISPSSSPKPVAHRGNKTGNGIGRRVPWKFFMVIFRFFRFHSSFSVVQPGSPPVYEGNRGKERKKRRVDRITLYFFREFRSISTWARRKIFFSTANPGTSVAEIGVPLGTGCGGTA